MGTGTCMNKFKAFRIYSGRSELNPYDVAFSRLVDELEAPLFLDLCRFLVESLNDRYRDILEALGFDKRDQSRANVLKQTLHEHYGSLISVLNQTKGSGFISASTVQLGDVLNKVGKEMISRKNTIHSCKHQRFLEQIVKSVRKRLRRKIQPKLPSHLHTI